MPFLHIPSKTEIIEGLGRVNIASFSACPAGRTVQPSAVPPKHSFSGPSTSGAPEKNANFYQRKTETQKGREFSYIDKSLNALRNMNHLSDVFKAM